MVKLSVCKSNESNSVSMLSENPLDIARSESVKAFKTQLENYKI